MHYRLAAPDDIPEAGRLAAHSFPSPERTPGWWESRLREPAYGGGADTLFIGCDQHRVAAACQIHPLRQWVAGEAMPMTGVGTVAISPAHRKQGLAAELVGEALREGRERGDIVSALFPFRVSFYQRLGYGLAGEALQYQVPANTLPDSAERHRVELLDSDHLSTEALALYSRWAACQTGQLERTPEVWLQATGEPGRALFGYRSHRGELEGYAVVVYRTDTQPRFLEVDELVWTTDAARRGLYGWLGSLGDQWPQIMLRALPSERLGDWLREPRLPHGAAPLWRLWAPSATLMSGPMFRLLDVRAAFEGRRIEPAPTIAVAIEVVDPLFEENRGSWRVALDGGRSIVERTGALDLSLRMDISTLSRIFVGALSPSAALRAGLLECDHTGLLSVLDTALAMPEPWTFDRF
ncbi:MAG TPA: GNAT family N-acetyltransferase [Longimicrobiales bacterium]|nr:GNAT family N-acetyltransferase [Longimicrobiales bacterium]